MSQSTDPKIIPHTLPELAAILVKHHGLHEGLFELAVELTVGIGAVGPDEKASMPGAIIGIRGIGLRETKQTNHLTIDAAQVNPRSGTPRKRAVAKR